MRTALLSAVGSALLLTVLAVASCRDAGPVDARERILALNLESGWLLDPAAADSILAAEQSAPTGRRLGAWARRFLATEGIEYRFGGAMGGYVTEGRLVLDDRHDCVSLMYRCSELAGARNARDAVDRALKMRFAGADPDSLTDGNGHVDYLRPEHLDYSLDMIRSGWWGTDITPTLTGARPDSAGSARYPAGSFLYVPTSGLVESELLEGDIAWLVLDAANEAAGGLRAEFGLVIGHLGVVVVEAGRPWLVHAASSDLPGWYEGGTVVRVPLLEYLSRVEKFGGVVVTRY